MKQLFSILLITFLTVNISFGQEKIKGNLDLTYTMDFGEESEAAAMMGESTMRVIYSKDKKARATVNVMGGFLTTEVITDESGNFVMLMNVMGQKMKVVPTAEEMKGLQEEAKEDAGNIDVTYDTKDTKEILGYKCHKATVKTDAGTVVLYVTTDIQVEAPEDYSSQTMSFQEVEGFPLEIITEEQGETISFIATKINSEIAADAFEYDDEGYEEMSFSDLENLGGM